MKSIAITFISISLILILVIPENRVISAKIDDVFKGAENVKCSKRTEEKSETLMQILIPLGTDQHLPENPAQLRKYCNLANKNIPFILGVIKHCTSPFAQTIAKLMFYPVRKNLDNMCKPGKVSRVGNEFITASKCGNLARNRIKECNEKLMDAMSGVTIAPLKNRINMMCCHTNAFRQCLRDATEETVGCNRHTVDWAERFVLKAAGGSITLVCGEYFQESDKCIKMIEQTPKSQYIKPNSRPKTLLKPMISLMESFPDLDTNN